LFLKTAENYANKSVVLLVTGSNIQPDLLARALNSSK
jgi:hypothetical protein